MVPSSSDEMRAHPGQEGFAWNLEAPLLLRSDPSRLSPVGGTTQVAVSRMGGQVGGEGVSGKE
jgi:hypothetical protein